MNRVVDKISKLKRSENMQRIRSKNTNPELLVRSLAHQMGYRYRLHNLSLPGKPDLVFPSRRKIILVHGCFWHFHGRCIDGHVPKSRKKYWAPKLLKNKKRDISNRRKLRRLGWSTLVIWECQLRKLALIKKRIKQFLK